MLHIELPAGSSVEFGPRHILSHARSCTVPGRREGRGNGLDLETALAAANEARIEFLKTQLSLAHTFLDVAGTMHRSEHRLGGYNHSRKVYRSAVKYLPRLRLSLEQALDSMRGSHAWKSA